MSPLRPMRPYRPAVLVCAACGGQIHAAREECVMRGWVLYHARCAPSETPPSAELQARIDRRRRA